VKVDQMKREYHFTIKGAKVFAGHGEEELEKEIWNWT